MFVVSTLQCFVINVSEFVSHLFSFLLRREKTTKEMESEVTQVPRLDLGFKDGQTIKINLAGVS